MKGEPLFSPLDLRRHVSLRELAELIGRPPSTVRRWALEGMIPGATRLGKGNWRISRAGAEKLWATMQQPQNV